MSMELMQKAAEASLKADPPVFEIGDTVNVSVRIIEGEKERVQVFTGTVIARSGSGIQETFIVRRIVAGEGVERTFPVHSPRIASVEVIRRAHTRRAKLYFLRERIGKATQLRERRKPAGVKSKAAARREAKAAARQAAREQAKAEAEAAATE